MPDLKGAIGQFDYKLMESKDPSADSFNDIAVDPNNPNREVDGRDFLVWQRGSATPGPDDNVGLAAGQETDNGLLLPAVRMDDAEASLKDGTSNTDQTLGDPITFTYTVTNTSADLFPTETYKPTESLFDL